MSSRVHSSLIEAEFEAVEGRSIRLAVRVVAVSESRIVEGRPLRSLRLLDQEGGQGIDTTPVENPVLMRRGAAAVRSGAVLVAQGEIVAAGKKGGGARLHLSDLLAAPAPSVLLGPDPDLLARTDLLLDGLIKEGNFFDYLCQRSYELLSIDPTFSDRFKQTVHLVGLQALSQGQLPSNVNDRLSVGIWSSPAQGKKVFTELAKLWAPAAQVVQPALVSGVGLSARVEQGKGGAWKTSPGAMPLCAGGVCVVEDYQRVATRDLPKVEGVLMSVMEDGRIAPVKAATATYMSNCAVLINANRRSEAQGSGRGKRGDIVEERKRELSLCGEILSRCDVMVELHTGEDPALGAENQAVMDPPVEFELPEEEVAARKEVSLLVARLRDRIKTVDTAPVRKEVRQLMRDVAVVVRDQCATGQATLDGDSLLRRMANAAKKLIAASARLHGRSVAEPADVDVAWDMLALKMEMVGYICGQGEVAQPLLPRAQQVAKAKEREELRFLRLLHQCGGGAVTLAEAAAALGMNVKQVGRELWRRGQRPKEGVLHLPTLEGYKQEVQERVAKEEREAEAAQRRGEALAKAKAEAEARPAAPPLEFWRAPDPAEAEAVQQTLLALRAPPPGPAVLPVVPRRFAELVVRLGALHGEARRAAASALVCAVDPRSCDLMVESRLTLGLKNGLVRWCEGWEMDAVTEGAIEMGRWALEGGPEGGWALRALALLAAGGLLQEAQAELARLHGEHPVEQVRAGIGVVLEIWAAAEREKIRVWMEQQKHQPEPRDLFQGGS